MTIIPPQYPIKPKTLWLAVVWQAGLMAMAHAVDKITSTSKKTEIMLLLARSKADVNVRGAVSSYLGGHLLQRVVLCPSQILVVRPARKGEDAVILLVKTLTRVFDQ